MSADLKIRAVLFDVYRTLVDIWTDEHRPEVWSRLAYFLRYRGFRAEAAALHAAFVDRSRLSQRESTEEHPEVDVLGIFQGLLDEMERVPGIDDTADAEEVAQLFRSLSLVRLGLFPDTLPALRALRGRFKLGLVSNAQRVYLQPELAILDLPGWMDVIVVSSDHGYQKPDRRLFQMALERLGVQPGEAIFVGDTISRDICGARDAGIRAALISRDGRGDDQERTCEPDLVFHSLDELCTWLTARASAAVA